MRADLRVAWGFRLTEQVVDICRARTKFPGACSLAFA